MSRLIGELLRQRVGKLSGKAFGAWQVFIYTLGGTPI
jgi:hypothetical protein